MGLVTTLGIDIQHNSFECHCAECRNAQCREYINVFLRVVILNVIMPSVIRLNVAAPLSSAKALCVCFVHFNVLHLDVREG
jgi:hypothetical protein